MRGESHSDWSSTNGISVLSSRDCHALRGHGSVGVMQGSDAYREVLYELQQENSYCEDAQDGSQSSDEDESDLFQRRQHVTHDPLVRTPSFNAQPGRSILRNHHSSNSDEDSIKAKRVTFKDCSDVVHSSVTRRASIAESNPSYRYRTRAKQGPVTDRGVEEGDTTRCSPKPGTNCGKGVVGPASCRTRRHSLPDITPPVINGVSNDHEDCDVQDRSLQDATDDDEEEEEQEAEDGEADNAIKCEVVHSFTPRPRLRRCSYAGISGYEQNYKDDQVGSGPRSAATPRGSNGRGTQPKKQISPTYNGAAKSNAKKTAATKGNAKGVTAKGRKDTTNSRRHSVF